MAINVKCFFVCIESDLQASACIRANISSPLHFKDVRSFTFDMIEKAIAPFAFQAVLVAGGSPCQGNSPLNPAGQGLADPRTQLYSHILRVGGEAEAWVHKHRHGVPVLTLMENVLHPRSFIQEVSSAFGSLPYVTEAFDFGWVRRQRAWWMKCSTSVSSDAVAALPKSCSVQFFREFTKLQYNGPPLPKRPRFEDGFKTHHTSLQDSWEGLFPFTRCFHHPTDRCKMHRRMLTVASCRTTGTTLP